MKIKEDKGTTFDCVGEIRLSSVERPGLRCVGTSFE